MLKQSRKVSDSTLKCLVFVTIARFDIGGRFVAFLIYLFGRVKVRNEVDPFFIEVWPQKRRFFFGMSTKAGWGKIPPKKINVQTDVTRRGI